MEHRDVEQYLKVHGIKPSHHRMRVYQYLTLHRNHPNVEMIYQELVDEIPTLSRTTLYNILSLFLEKGIVQLLTITENEMRYDADTSWHGHFRCHRCGKIYDIPVRDDAIDLEALVGFEVEESQIYFRGLCPNCRAE
jgi:Fe2+ or Zn2+ uptake regulation protein